MIIHTKCGSLWITPWHDKNSIFLKIEKSKKLIFPIETQTFFIEKLGGPFFLSQSLPTLVILHTKFGLIWTTSWPDKKDLFLKLLIWKNRNFPYKKLIFLLGKIYKKFFLLYTFITLVIIHTKCGSLWTTPWPDKNSIFWKIEKIEKVDISDWNTNFFSRKVVRAILLVSESTYPGDTLYQVWFDLNNFLTRKKTYF